MGTHTPLLRKNVAGHETQLVAAVIHVVQFLLQTLHAPVDVRKKPGEHVVQLVRLTQAEHPVRQSVHVLVATVMKYAGGHADTHTPL